MKNQQKYQAKMRKKTFCPQAIAPFQRQALFEAPETYYPINQSCKECGMGWGGVKHGRGGNFEVSLNVNLLECFWNALFPMSLLLFIVSKKWFDTHRPY